MTHNRKLNILLSAYACEPDEGSEQEVGWKWAHEISKMCDVTVITRNNSRFRIEAWQQSHPGQMRAKFLYLDVGGLAGVLKKRIPGGLYIYYFLWQLKVRTLVKSKFQYILLMIVKQRLTSVQMLNIIMLFINFILWVVFATKIIVNINFIERVFSDDFLFDLNNI